MKLSDVMSAAGLSSFAEVALVLFLIAFLAVCWSVLSKKNAQKLERARYLPLEDAPHPDAPRPRFRPSSPSDPS